MLSLPHDLFAYICVFLNNNDKKNLRLTNKRLNSLCSLRINRVFVSPSYKNIEVFQAIAAHPIFRHEVKEIIWDDARFEKFERIDQDRDDLLPEERARNKLDFTNICQENFIGDSEEQFLKAKRGGLDPELGEPLSAGSDVSNEAHMTLDESFDLYDRLYEEQESIVQNSLDIEAFKQSLDSFPNLERVTITSEAYRPNIFNPHYQTPLIRSFPLGFSYPSPWPWMAEPPLDDDLPSSTAIRRHWRGVILVLEALAHCKHQVSEFVIDTCQEQLGVTYQLFQAPSADLQNFENLCHSGRLKRLDLAINTFNYFQNPGLSDLPRGQLKSCLEKVTSLQHLVLHLSTGNDSYSAPREDETIDPLSLIPLDAWPLLKHMTLSSIPMIYSHLIEFLRRLPRTVQTLTLINVEFAGDGTYKSLLQTCKDELHWTGDGRDHPSLTIAQQENGPLESRKLWTRNEEINNFFSGAGHNPFVGRSGGNQIQEGFGVVRDDFDDGYFKPNIPNPLYSVYVSPGVYRQRTRDEAGEQDV